MQLKQSILMSIAPLAVGSAAWTALAHGGVHNFSASFALLYEGTTGILTRTFLGMAEPVRLLLMGVCLIALSVIVRRRGSGKRNR